MSFLEKFRHAVDNRNSRVCVGLDPDPLRLPAHLAGTANPVSAFLKEIVSATQDLVCAYKPNFAFFGAMGPAGWQSLTEVIHAIPATTPVVLDFKAGDIGNSAARYAQPRVGRLPAACDPGRTVLSTRCEKSGWMVRNGTLRPRGRRHPRSRTRHGQEHRARTSHPGPGRRSPDGGSRRRDPVRC